jgi:hypothetical protein
VSENKKEVNIMFTFLELCQQKDFIDFLEKTELGTPVFFNNAPALEIVEKFGGKLTSYQLTSW